MTVWMASLGWFACLLVLLPSIFFMIQNIDRAAVRRDPLTLLTLTLRDLTMPSFTLPNASEILLRANTLFRQENFKEAAKLYENWIVLTSQQETQQGGQRHKEQQRLLFPSAEDPHVAWALRRLLKCHLFTRHLADAERWAHLLHHAGYLRAEPAYYLCQALREEGEFGRAYSFYLLASNLPLQAVSEEEGSALFPTRLGMQEYWLNYEKSMLWWHVGGLENRYTTLHGLALSMQLLEKPGLPLDLRQSVYNNLQHHVYSLNCSFEILWAEKPTEEEWRFSTPTFLGDQTLVRVVNYYISNDGSYHVSKGDKVNTRLMVDQTEAYFKVDCSDRFRSAVILSLQGTHSDHHLDAYVLGLEDTRVVVDRSRRDTIYTLSASAEYSREPGIMNQVLGILNMSDTTMWVQGIIRGPREHQHDKNWVFAGGLDHVVYDWYPTIQIGSIDVGELALRLHTHIPSPKSFHDMRGSTNGVFYDHEWWFVTHSVIHRPQQMRKYIHYLVVLNEDLASISRYSLPFTFEPESDVEYCLGLKVETCGLTFGYSVRDRSSRVMTVPLGELNELFVDRTHAS